MRFHGGKRGFGGAPCGRSSAVDDYRMGDPEVTERDDEVVVFWNWSWQKAPGSGVSLVPVAVALFGIIGLLGWRSIRGRCWLHDV
jgi:hypothetical protein